MISLSVSRANSFDQRKLNFVKVEKRSPNGSKLSENRQMINLSFCISENIWATIGILSTQVTSRSQQLNPRSCSMYSECSCNSEFDVMFSGDKENWGLLGQHSQDAEKRRWMRALVLITTQYKRLCTEPGGTFHLDHSANGAPLILQ